MNPFENYVISTDKNRLDVNYVHRFLVNSYWATGIALETIKKSIANSLCFGLYNENKQIGYARIITDNTTFAYLCDVFIDPAFQGRGLGKWFINHILNNECKPMRRFLLATRDAHGFYHEFGFTSLKKPDTFMEIFDSNFYNTKI